MLATLALAVTPGNQANAANMKPAELVSFPDTHVAQVADDLQLSGGGGGTIIVDGSTRP